MARTKELTITQSKGNFILFRKKKNKENDLDTSDISALRQVLSNEKARLLHIIKTQNPNSLYDLAKKSGRNFKSIADDIKLLERFGFVQLVQEKTKNRVRHRPQVLIDNLIINFKI
jgi:predicted transcriptional regulator